MGKLVIVWIQSSPVSYELRVYTMYSAMTVAFYMFKDKYSGFE